MKKVTKEEKKLLSRLTSKGVVTPSMIEAWADNLADALGFSNSSTEIFLRNFANILSGYHKRVENDKGSNNSNNK